MGTENRAAVYVRISKANVQDAANQRPDVEALAASKGLRIVRDYEDAESAVKVRSGYNALMAGARRHEFDVVIVWALDRLHRSMMGAIDMVLELDRLGIRVVSARESWLDLESPIRPLLVAIFGWVAEQERRRLRERTLAGLNKARAAGTKLGRPRVVCDLKKARALRASGAGLRSIAKALGIGASTVGRLLAADDQLRRAEDAEHDHGHAETRTENGDSGIPLQVREITAAA